MQHAHPGRHPTVKPWRPRPRSVIDREWNQYFLSPDTRHNEKHWATLDWEGAKDRIYYWGYQWYSWYTQDLPWVPGARSHPFNPYRVTFELKPPE